MALKKGNADKIAIVHLEEGATLTFHVTREAFSHFLSENTKEGSDQLLAMKDLLVNAADDDSTPAVVELCDDWVNIPVLCGAVMEQVNQSTIKLAKKPIATAKVSEVTP